MKQNIPSKLKISNRKIIYKYLSVSDGLSRADLARITGISGATVIKIMDFLESKNIISYDNIDENSSVVGRKPRPIIFNSHFAHMLTIHIEGKYLSIGIVDVRGNIVALKEAKIADFAYFINNEFIKTINELIISAKIESSSLIGIGLAVPAVFDETKNVVKAPLFKETPINLSKMTKPLLDEFHLPLFIENDVNASAYGEYTANYSATEKDLLYISLGSGLGSGIILNSQIRKGTKGAAGEIGYMVFENGTKSPANDIGWLENKINLDAITDKFNTDLRDYMTGYINEDIIDYISDYLSLAIANIYAVLDIKNIVLGGITANYLGDALICATNKKCKLLNDLIPTLAPCKLKNPGFAGMGAIIVENLLEEILYDDKDD